MTQHDQWNIVSGVGLTALAAAAARAVESSRPGGLIDDPYAAAFVAAARAPVALPVRWPADGADVSDQELLLLYGSGYVGLRSRFFDDYLAASRSDGIEQLVVLAAGLDTRAFRLDGLAGSRVFEIDQPAVLEFKDAVLCEAGATPRCARHAVGCDLREDWATPLREAGFDAHTPTAWLAEGLLQYLPPGAEQTLVERVEDLSAPGSRLAVERSANLAGLVDGSVDGSGDGTDDGTDDGTGGRLREISERTGIPMDKLVEPADRPDPATWLERHGWAVTDEPVAAVAERYHRDLANPGLPLPRTARTPAPRPTARPTTTSYLSARRAG